MKIEYVTADSKFQPIPALLIWYAPELSLPIKMEYADNLRRYRMVRTPIADASCTTRGAHAVVLLPGDHGG